MVEQDGLIAFQRTVVNVPEVCNHEEMTALQAKFFLHERGNVSNICPDYAKVIASGLNAVLASIEGKEGELYEGFASKSQLSIAFATAIGQRRSE